EPQAPSHASERIAARRQPVRAPPHRPVSAPAAPRTDHAHPPARADGPRAPSHTGWTAHGEGRLAGTLPRGRTAGTLPRERTDRCPAPAGACAARPAASARSEEHTSELQSRENLVCRLLLEKKKKQNKKSRTSRYSTDFILTHSFDVSA